MESVRVRLRKKRGRSWDFEEIEIPTDAEMERIAAELHKKRVPRLITVLGWKVFYLPAAPLKYTSTEVNPFTGERGASVPHETTTVSHCVFGRGAEWQVSYTWDRGDDQAPTRTQKRGDVVAIAAGNQGSLFSQTNDLLTDIDASERLFEGAIQNAELTSYERNREARRRCIEQYGEKCFLCGFDFGNVYGDVAEGFIHVHHLTPLSDTRVEHVVDPVQELRPVCPNCHAVLHMQTPPFSIEEVWEFLGRLSAREPNAAPDRGDS